MTFYLPLIFAGVIAGWALLSIVGNERTRRIQEVEAMEAAASANKAIANKDKDKPIVVGSPLKSAQAAPKAAGPAEAKPPAAAPKPAAAAPKSATKPKK